MKHHFTLKRIHSIFSRVLSLTGSCLPGLFFISVMQLSAYAQPPQAEIDAAIQRGAAFVKKNKNYGRTGINAFVAYALIKSGESPESPFIQNCLKNILADHNQKNEKGEIEYKPGADYNYCAGAQLMVLEAIDPEKYHDEIKATANFLISTQHPGGSWFYPRNESHNGDTSITQYAVLGLWAAERAGVTIPTAVWDKAARWHLTVQLPDGGFGYHPAERGGNLAKSTMGVAGTGSLFIISMQLYPNGELRNNEVKKSKTKKRFGFLEKVDLTQAEKKKEEINRIVKPTVSFGALKAGKNRGVARIVRTYNVRDSSGWPNYYLYGIERIAAIANAKMLGSHDWYAEGATHLLSMQREDGSWKGNGPFASSTCLAMIFLSKATGKTLGRTYSPEPVGSGLLAGGRGLPKNLAEVQMRDGKIENKKIAGNLSQLLAQLEDPANANLEATQETLVETIILGDREQLIKQKVRVLKLIDARAPDVRRTAIWALARTNDFRMAPYLIRALKDPDLDVRIEARNGLCTLSRKIQGLGMPADPLADAPDNLDEKERIQLANQWSEEATKRWHKWYNSVKPFDEKFDFFEVLHQKNQSQK